MMLFGQIFINKKIEKMKKLIMLSLLLLTTITFGQQVFYTEDNSNISNPERGRYMYTDDDSSETFSPLNQTQMVNWRVNDKITLVWRTYYMNAYINSILPETYLNNIQNDLNKARLSGVKLIVRFAYNRSSVDATKARILGHIDQLKVILNSNEDVISSLEAGFIGEYGEWYNSSNFGNTDNLTTTQLNNRIEIGNKIFELCPNRPIAFRTPKIMQQIVGNLAMDNTQAYTGTNLSRMGYHNDCFLRTGWEGFTNTTTEYPYLNSQTKFTVAGGESCGILQPNTDCTIAVSTLDNFHFNYLNQGYFQGVWDNWQSQGCKNEIINRLGYRFVLRNSTLNDNQLIITLENIGFGNLFNNRIAYIVYKNIATGIEYSEILNSNPRFWLKENTGVYTLHNLNTTLPNGEYRLYLNLPDNMLSSNPLYSIRCANLNTWEESTGYNNLNQTFIINELSNPSTPPTIVFNILPNPTSNNLTISGLTNLGTYTFKVFNMTGNTMRVTRNGTTLNTNRLKSGTYILQVSKNGLISTKKFIKQ